MVPQSSSTEDPTATAITEAIPNWRVLSLLPTEEDANGQADITRALLQERAEWSFQNYQEALALYDKFVACSDSYVAPGVKEALNCLDHAYRIYGPHSVLCSFNGGKDAVVILQLLRAAHAHHYRQQQENGRDTGTIMVRPRTIYFEHQDEFPQVLSYLQNIVQDYDLDMISFERGVNFNQGLQVLVRNNIPPLSSIAFPMAFVLGTRVGDPNAGSQGYFAPSSHYMPPFMRVNPILEWTYGQVWHFLRVFSLPYCVLYDQGYTSLGTTKDTLPCPALAVPGSSLRDTSLPKHWPAYMLQDWSQERAGRIPKQPKDKKHNTTATTTSTETTSTKQQQQKGPPTAAPSSIRESVISIPSALRATDPPQIDPVAVAPSSSSNVSQDGNSGMLPDDSRSCWSYGSNHSLTQRTVGLLVIGDEILKGSTADTNTMAAAKCFREKSVLLKKVVVVSDEQEAIVNEILAMQNEVDVIVTSGGVGPTHDDVTIKSVAVALNQELVLHEEMAKLLQEKMNQSTASTAGQPPQPQPQQQPLRTAELTDAQRKMATLPARSKLKYLSPNPSDWPVLQCRNVFVLPGVPQFFATKIGLVAEYVSSDELERSAVYKVVLSVDETAIVSILNAAVGEHPEVSFGSYPFVSHREFKTVLTLEGRLKSSTTESFEEEANRRTSFSKDQMDHHVRLALDYLLTHLPEGSILRVENDDGLS